MATTMIRLENKGSGSVYEVRLMNGASGGPLEAGRSGEVEERTWPGSKGWRQSAMQSVRDELMWL